MQKEALVSFAISLYLFECKKVMSLFSDESKFLISNISISSKDLLFFKSKIFKISETLKGP